MVNHILLLSATPFEVADFILKYPQIPHLVAGVGIPNTVFKLQQYLHQNPQITTVIQAGIAGAYPNSNLGIGQAVSVISEVFADLGAWQNSSFLSLQDLHLHQTSDIIIAKQPEILPSFLQAASGATVQLLTDNQSLISATTQRWQAQCESMEGAAAAMVCLQMDKSFVQIRAISNWVGDRNTANWAIKPAIDELNNSLTKYLKLFD